MHAAWGKPDISLFRRRLIAVVSSLRIDIDAGDSRTAQAAVEELSGTFLELEDTDVPANYIVRQRSKQAGLRKALPAHLPPPTRGVPPVGYSMIVTLVGLILLNIISTPFKVGMERTDDDVSLFLRSEFVVHAQASEGGEVVLEDVEALAEDVEEQLVEVEEQDKDPAKTAESAHQTVSGVTGNTLVKCFM
jgi:hypothetical protein